ncbi:hypothetical protein DFH09DRAFT_987128 [Mycena vulgaris]|nr:hypothetical protein DFH09DRAFT_987128 [Mycena vulgaris]
MALPPEAYRTIVRSVARRRDLAALCAVSRAFRRAAERALYNTLTVSDADARVCDTLAANPRISGLVEALTVLEASEAGSVPSTVRPSGESSSTPPLDAYWTAVAATLRTTSNLLHLTISLPDPTAVAWVFAHTTFQLRTFHCDLAWDDALSAFLGTQRGLRDLYLGDWGERPREDEVPIPATGLPALATLECTFPGAAVALAPGRPLRRLKTCFAAPDLAGKRAELGALMDALSRSRMPLRALDLADDVVRAGALQMELLRRVANEQKRLRYLGTLVLPVGGRERLRFYGLLRRLRRLLCVELDVSSWRPAPAAPSAMCALVKELRLYCPAVHTVIFVLDFERTVVSAVGGILSIDEEASPEGFWREI